MSPLGIPGVLPVRHPNVELLLPLVEEPLFADVQKRKFVLQKIFVLFRFERGSDFAPRRFVPEVIS